MTFDSNDPRLTAYVLGELDPSERPEIEAMLESSAEGHQVVEEIRQTIGWLSDHLRDERAAHAVGPESNHRPHLVFPTPAPTPLPRDPGCEGPASGSSAWRRCCCSAQQRPS